jgi:adenylate cyclase
MRPDLSRKLKNLALICLFTSIAGMIYQVIDDKVLDFRSVIVGFPLGLAFGVLELFLFPKTKLLRRWSFSKMLVFKAVTYTSVIYGVTIVLMLIMGLAEGRKVQELWVYLVSPTQLILVIYTLAIYSLLVFLLQVNSLLGEGVLWKFIRGKYHKPREEERIFMFLDMKSSTTAAEHLGHIRFYTLMNDLFHEISQPVLKTKAEIYQYVGDEVVLTWEMKDGLENSNCLKLFFLFREILLQKSDDYWRDFGFRPQFKAGVHLGKVITAQIGDLKREIVYNGDVLNTTSRIQHECNKYQRDCLVSGSLMQHLKQVNAFKWEKVDTVLLRGKETEVELFSVNG